MFYRIFFVYFYYVYIYIYIYIYRSEGDAERDISSLGAMGWGVVILKVISILFPSILCYIYIYIYICIHIRRTTHNICKKEICKKKEQMNILQQHEISICVYIYIYIYIYEKHENMYKQIYESM